MTQLTTERRAVALSPAQLDRLVEKVYRLILADLRLARARCADSAQRGKERRDAVRPR